tara:strand:- start:3 stop:302 length:300 start_codon:yes stop_codon:yes gene_type:complete
MASAYLGNEDYTIVCLLTEIDPMPTKLDYELFCTADYLRWENEVCIPKMVELGYTEIQILERNIYNEGTDSETVDFVILSAVSPNGKKNYYQYGLTDWC